MPEEPRAILDLRWFADIRKIALIALITSIGGAVVPLRDGTLKAIELASTYPRAKVWVAIFVVVLYLILALLPIFYLALYRDKQRLRISKRFRSIMMGALALYGLYVAITTTDVARSFGAFWTVVPTFRWSAGGAIAAALESPLTIQQASNVLGEFSSIAQFLLLFALFRKASEEKAPIDFGGSKFLRYASTAAAVAFGLFFTFCLLRLVLSPALYFYVASLARKYGRAGPSYRQIAWPVIPFVLSGAGLFAAPYIVYRSSKEWVNESAPAEISNS